MYTCVRSCIVHKQWGRDAKYAGVFDPVFTDQVNYTSVDILNNNDVICDNNPRYVKYTVYVATTAQ